MRRHRLIPEPVQFTAELAVDFGQALLPIGEAGGKQHVVSGVPQFRRPFIGQLEAGGVAVFHQPQQLSGFIVIEVNSFPGVQNAAVGHHLVKRNRFVAEQNGIAGFPDILHEIRVAQHIGVAALGRRRTQLFLRDGQEVLPHRHGLPAVGHRALAAVAVQEDADILEAGA